MRKPMNRYRPRREFLAAPAIEPRPLTLDDLPSLRLDHHPRLSPAEAQSVLGRRPGASCWVPETGEFILVAPWRHRNELVTVHTSGAFAHEDMLLDAVMTQARDDGAIGFVVVDINETRQPTFYARHGLRRVEEIVTYEHRRLARLSSTPGFPGIEFLRVDGNDPGLLEAVIALDHAAFPWFWWNSDEEFRAYLAYTGVEVWAGLENGDVVAYVGFTQYLRWGHLDRIAVHPTVQGLGVGRAALAFAARALQDRGCRRLALSTQGNNARSRSLYQRTGFVRTPNDDYGVYVVPWDESRLYAGMIR